MATSSPAAPQLRKPRPEASQATSLNLAKASSIRPNDSLNNPTTAPGESLPRSSTVANAQQQLRSGGLRNPPEMQKALQLAKQIGHGRRDKSKSSLAQGLGEAGAQGGRLLGGTIGSALPVVGSTAGAVIGKRIGRIAGENWKKTLIIGAVAILMIVLPYVALIAIVIISIIAAAKEFNLL